MLPRTAALRTNFARAANLSVERVSVTSASAGETQTMRHVLQLPPRLCCSSRVSTESRNGTKRRVAPRCFSFDSVSAAITLPSASRDVLIFCASASAAPLAPERPTSSEPCGSRVRSCDVWVNGRRGIADRESWQGERAVGSWDRSRSSHRQVAHGESRRSGGHGGGAPLKRLLDRAD